jgi:integrase
MPITIFKRGDVYHYRGTVAGRRIRGSTGTADKARAQRIAAEREDREWKRGLDGPEAVLTFADAAILYRQAEKPTRFLTIIEDYWKETPVRNVTPGAIRAAAITLYPNAGGATRNRQVIVPMQAVINHAAGLELCRTIRVKRFPVTTKDKEPATWEWIECFMAVASPNLGALACFMFLTGARITEAMSLTWGDVDLHARRALVRQTKIGAERRAHMPPVLVAAIANIPSNREPDAPVFGYSSRDTAKQPWRAAIRRAGIKPLSFHACRHGFATALLHKGIDPITVAKLGGWKDPRHVFATYGHARDDDTLADMIIGTPLTHGVVSGRKKDNKSNG